MIIGASVVVNDLGGSHTGEGTGNARLLLNVQAADANGDRIVATALQAFGRIDIVMNNAGSRSCHLWNVLAYLSGIQNLG